MFSNPPKLSFVTQALTKLLKFFERTVLNVTSSKKSPVRLGAPPVGYLGALCLPQSLIYSTLNRPVFS